MARIAAAWKFAQFLFWCALLIPPQFAVRALSRKNGIYVLPQLWHRMVCRAFGIGVEVVGAPVTGRQVLFAGNHVSYLDIPAISTVLPASFVAKADVASWPLFGLLAKLQETAFIGRTRNDVRRAGNAVAAFMAGGRSLVIFPEGTSSNGAAVLPFKSSLFDFALASAAGGALVVQPFTVEIAAVDGRPALTAADRDIYAWYGDMTLMPHFWNFAKTRGAKVRLHFHPPLQVKEGDNRKELAAYCHKAVAGALAEKMPCAA